MSNFRGNVTCPRCTGELAELQDWETHTSVICNTCGYFFGELVKASAGDPDLAGFFPLQGGNANRELTPDTLPAEEEEAWLDEPDYEYAVPALLAGEPDYDDDGQVLIAGVLYDEATGEEMPGDKDDGQVLNAVREFVKGLWWGTREHTGIQHDTVREQTGDDA